MSRDETLEHQAFGLSGRALCLALFGKYIGLSAYGIWSAVVEIPTFIIVASSQFAVVWAGLISVFSGLAAMGVARTWATGYFRLEKWSTAAFIALFSGYSYALAYRSITSQDWDSAPLILVPLVVCIMPAIRYFSLVIRSRNIRHTQRGAR